MNIKYERASSSDFKMLVDLRLEAMRESLIKVGRFNRERSIERFRSSFAPENTQKILSNRTLVGFYTLNKKEDHLHLDHLYIKPDCQSAGIGSTVMSGLIEHSEKLLLPIRLGALRESRSNVFYQKHGFVAVSEDEWDIYYERSIRSPGEQSQ